MTSGVAVSVVIGSHDAGNIIDECLTALMPQAERWTAEVIVADSSGDGTAERIAARFPAIRVLAFGHDWTLPRLRGRAIAAASGAIIVILDPFSIVGPDWLQEVVTAHRDRPNLAIGGAVEPYEPETQGYGRWATYINEYGLFMLPVRAGECAILPGSNVSYKRAALFDAHDRPKYDVFWKTFVNWEIEAGGSALWLAPSIVVRLHKPVGFWNFLRTRYHHGRCFAGMRGGSRGERWLRAIAFPALPLLLFWRWSTEFRLKRRYWGKLLQTAPCQLLLFGSWAIGEFAGYSRGTGSSCRRLFY